LGSEPPTRPLETEGIFAKTEQKHAAVLTFRDSLNSGSGLAASVKLTASSLVHLQEWSLLNTWGLSTILTLVCGEITQRAAYGWV